MHVKNACNTCRNACRNSSDVERVHRPTMLVVSSARKRRYALGSMSDAFVNVVLDRRSIGSRRETGMGALVGRTAAAGAGQVQTTVPEFIAVYVTVPNAESGKLIASKLIHDRLAACVNVIPGIESMYWWEGKVETDSELLLMIKSRARHLDALTRAVTESHPYDVPEVIAVPITGGSPTYLDWLRKSTEPMES